MSSEGNEFDRKCHKTFWSPLTSLRYTRVNGWVVDLVPQKPEGGLLIQHTCFKMYSRAGIHIIPHSVKNENIRILFERRPLRFLFVLANTAVRFSIIATMVLSFTIYNTTSILSMLSDSLTNGLDDDTYIRERPLERYKISENIRCTKYNRTVYQCSACQILRCHKQGL